MCAFVGVLLK